MYVYLSTPFLLSSAFLNMLNFIKLDDPRLSPEEYWKNG